MASEQQSTSLLPSRYRFQTKTHPKKLIRNHIRKDNFLFQMKIDIYFSLKSMKILSDHFHRKNIWPSKNHYFGLEKKDFFHWEKIVCSGSGSPINVVHMAFLRGNFYIFNYDKHRVKDFFACLFGG